MSLFLYSLLIIAALSLALDASGELRLAWANAWRGLANPFCSWPG